MATQDDPIKTDEELSIIYMVMLESSRNGVLTETIHSALKIIKENPELSIKTVMDMAYKEWNK